MIALRVAVILIAVAGPLAAQTPAPGKKYALLVGVNEYKIRTLENLKYAEKDIADLAALLKSAGFEVESLLGSGKGPAEATRLNIKTGFETLLKAVTKDDTLLLAFSGHGQQLVLKENGKDREVPFFCPKDADPVDPNTLISLAGMLDDLSRRGGKANLLLVDACRNVNENPGSRGGIDGNRIESLGIGTAAFFACSGRQRAMESEKAGGGHGVFFHFVLEGLKGAPGATDAEGQVTWDGLIPYVKRQVKTQSAVWFAALPAEERQVPHLISNLAADPLLTLPGLDAVIVTDMKEVFEISRIGKSVDDFYQQNAPRRMPQWKKAAEAGTPNGMFLYGRCLHFGIGTAKDEAKAVEWYSKAAALNNIPACNNLASCYLNGTGVARNAAKAFELFEKSAKAGFSTAQYNLGYNYMFGVGKPKDVKLGFEWLQKAAATGNRNAMNQLGNYFLNDTTGNKNEKLGIEWYEKAAALGQTDAINSMGYCHSKGLGVAKNHAKAVEWYEKAAALGDKFAYRNLAICYLNGWGVTADAKTSSEFYIKGAYAGDLVSMTGLAYRYANGLGLAKDPGKAFEWYQKAADGGSLDGMVNVGTCYRLGVGVVKAPAKSLEWYRKAADAGSTDGLNLVGLCHAGGIGVAKDAAIALEWYRKAANLGHLDAMANFASGYATGTGVAKNEATAFEWYQKAALAGHVESMNQIGLAYEKGTGVAKDTVKCAEWYAKAAAKGHVWAQCNLGLCYRYGRGVEVNNAEAIKWFRACVKSATAAGSTEPLERSKKHLTELGQVP